jgi:transcriptional regulator of arginine metabolism
MKQQRQRAILELVERQGIGRQEELRTRLRAQGFDVTQATLSRDIKALGLVKRASDGAYLVSEGEAAPTMASREQALARAAAEYLRRIETINELIVIRTDPGEAQPLARAIDRADLAEVAGTIGGDDTILVVARGRGRARALTRRLETWAGRVR